MSQQRAGTNLDTPMDDKKDVLHLDVVDEKNDRDVPLVARDKYLTLWQTIRQYPRASALSAAAAFGAVSDGYQFNLPGVSIKRPTWDRSDIRTLSLYQASSVSLERKVRMENGLSILSISPSGLVSYSSLHR